MTTNTNVTGKIALFELNDSLETMLDLQDALIKSKLFKLPTKKALTSKTDLTKEDAKIAESNVSDFITVWYRHARNGKNKEGASYGIRVKTSLANIPSMQALLANKHTSFNDDNEYRITCYHAKDVILFTATILHYLQVYAIKRKTKEVTIVESVTA